jgi:hypothetical protein
VRYECGVLISFCKCTQVIREREPSFSNSSSLATLASSLALGSTASEGFVRNLVCICGDGAASGYRSRGERVAPRLGTGRGSIRLNFWELTTGRSGPG